MKNYLLKVKPAIIQNFLINIFYGKSFSRRKFYFLNYYNFYMFLDPFSHLGNILLKEQLYEQNTSLLINKYLKNNSIFFDIGANEGFFSVLASKTIKRGEIYAFEPQTNLLNIVKKNLLKNNFNNFFLFNIGIGENSYYTKLNIFPDTNNGASSILKKNFLNIKKKKIKIEPLDKFVIKNNIFKKIDLIKIDIEGYEVKAIQGMKNLLLKKRIKTLLVDYHMKIIKKKDRLSCENFILSCGYKKILTKDKNLICYKI